MPMNVCMFLARLLLRAIVCLPQHRSWLNAYFPHIYRIFELFSSVDSRLCEVHHAFAPCGAVGDESDGQIPRISTNEGAISHENMYV